MDPKLTVAIGYDKIAREYLRQRERKPKDPNRSYLDRLTDGLPDGARVLDVGCGGGVPYAAYMSERFSVVGVDISRGQLALARELVPSASFVRADMASLPLKPHTFDAIAMLYSVIHVPREEHESLFRTLHSLLTPGGRLFTVVGAQEWEARESDWLVEGVEMFWSHFGPDHYLKLLERLGFSVGDSEIVPDPILEGAHLFVLAEKPA